MPHTYPPPNATGSQMETSASLGVVLTFALWLVHVYRRTLQQIFGGPPIQLSFNFRPVRSIDRPFRCFMVRNLRMSKMSARHSARPRRPEGCIQGGKALDRRTADFHFLLAWRTVAHPNSPPDAPLAPWLAAQPLGESMSPGSRERDRDQPASVFISRGRPARDVARIISSWDPLFVSPHQHPLAGSRPRHYRTNLYRPGQRAHWADPLDPRHYVIYPPSPYWTPRPNWSAPIDSRALALEH